MVEKNTCTMKRSKLKVWVLIILTLIYVFNVINMMSRDTLESSRDCAFYGCSRKYRIVARDCSSESKIPKPMSSLTMFTSFSYIKRKVHVNLNTLQNWKHIHHSPNVILFTNDSKVKTLGMQHKWTVQSVSEEPLSNVPTLRTLFMQSLTMHNSSFYMFGNADILFDTHLLETLINIDNFLHTNNFQNSPVLIVGRRTNINVSTSINDEPETWKEILNKSYRVHTRFNNVAFDYYITNKVFPWNDIPPLVIGRVGVDNYVVAYARYVGFVTIDASDAILAVHQTTESGNFEGFTHHNATFNTEIVQNKKLPYNYVDWSQADCCMYHVAYDVDNHVIVTKRNYLGLPVKCNLNAFSRRHFDGIYGALN